ncbi:ATP-dependent helicase HrpB [Neptuniibacter sp.]|uniref:ATP-dependent helicase HrpB n=1 Tax=Neptuniibacter sp. TaxID=1962643 RepID=UPI0026233025|nr:ATP-dependent helicase HrpB [Neptuniibacter sp.]MCP4596735.1 ATP-dependent helicase HrpB [Neptuniibacter sp.]
MIKLPIESALPSLKEALTQRNEVVLEAPPGAGKTTCVPIALLEQPWLEDQKIIMLEPRRLAARAAAERMASVLGEKAGETVGYRIRLESKISGSTRIEVVTEGVLTRMLQSDPSLEGYGLVIFDEFHERSLDADLGLALALEAREIFRDEDPLKLLVMSATLDGEAVAALLNNAPIIRSEGKSYPVKHLYSKPAQPNEWIEPRVVSTIQQALLEQSGSILCFLPGQKEIREVEKQLHESLQDQQDILLAPLYGNLTLEQQRQAIESPPEGKRKVVLATNIAETSLTIEGVEVVIDSGLSRFARFDPRTAMNRLQTRKVSKAEATQRSGRAGRLSPGVCYRLWSEGQQEQLNSFNPPEITQADLTPLALQLCHWGIKSPSELNWLDTPPDGSYQQAINLLQQLGALKEDFSLTEHGETMAQFPAHPRLAHMLIKATECGWQKVACRLAALLQDKDPLKQGGADIQDRLDWLTTKASKQNRINQQATSYLKLCQKLITQSEHAAIDQKDLPGLLLAMAYPDRIAKQRNQGGDTYRMNSGRAAAFFQSDALNKQQWIAVAQLNSKEGKATDYISLAAKLNPETVKVFLPELIQEKELVNWDQTDNRLLAEKQQSIGTLVLNSEPLSNASEEAINEAIIAFIRKQGIEIFNWSDELKSWRQRVNFVYEQEKSKPDTQWPDLSDKGLMCSLEQWLTPYLSGVRQLSHLKKLDLKNILQALLPWPLPQQLDQLAPERYQVPSGSRIRIDYSENPPVLAVKLQEMFGCKDTPVIGNGVALKLHLLSPAQRPLQVTQDLKSFWANSYTEVQKDMKGRYPKHPWPDDPLTAIATAKTKKASQR